MLDDFANISHAVEFGSWAIREEQREHGIVNASNVSTKDVSTFTRIRSIACLCIDEDKARADNDTRRRLAFVRIGGSESFTSRRSIANFRAVNGKQETVDAWLLVERSADSWNTLDFTTRFQSPRILNNVVAIYDPLFIVLDYGHNRYAFWRTVI